MMIIPGELDAWAYDKRSVSLLRSGALAARCGRAAPCRMGPQQRCARQTCPREQVLHGHRAGGMGGTGVQFVLQGWGSQGSKPLPQNSSRMKTKEKFKLWGVIPAYRKR